MNRRTFLRVGAGGCVVSLTGCSGLFGESEAAIDAIEAGSTALLDAHDTLRAEYERFGRLETTVTFDADAVEESLSTARDEFDNAGRAAQQEETRAGIDQLRRLAEALESSNYVGAGLASGYNAAREGLAEYDGGNYESAISRFQDGSRTLEDVESDIESAESAVQDVDPASIEIIEIDAGAVDDHVQTVTRSRNGYALVLDGLTPFTQGVSAYRTAESAYATEDFESAAESYRTARDYFRSSVEAFGDDSTGLPADVSEVATGLATIGEGMRYLMATMAAVSDAMAAFETSGSYVQAGRYDDAIERSESADDGISDARSHFENADGAFRTLEEGDSNPLDEIQTDELRNRLDTAGSGLEALDHMLTGMTAYIGGLREFDAAAASLDDEDYGSAGEEFSSATDEFETANGAFEDSETAAPATLEARVVELHCVSGAFRDAAGHYAAGSRALDRGDQQTANDEFGAGDDALGRCDSGSNPFA